MKNQERIQMVYDAQEKLSEAIELIAGAVNGSCHESHTKSYLTDHLQILAGDNHGFLARDYNCDKLIVDLENTCDECGYDDCDGDCDIEDVCPDCDKEDCECMAPSVVEVTKWD